MEIAASIKGASKEHKTGDTVITALQTITFDFMKKELTLIIGPSDSGKSVIVVIRDLRLKPFADRIIYVNNGITSGKSSEDEISHN